MHRKVLIAVDSFKREYLGIYLLKKELLKNGFKVRICSRYVLKYAFNHFRPEVVVVHSSYKIAELEEISRQAVLILLQAESCTGNELGILSYAAEISPLTRPEFIDFRYCWGKFDYDILKKHPVFPNAGLAVTGHPITDPWYRKRAPRKSKELTIGIATSLRAMTHISGAIGNPIKFIHDIEEGGQTSLFFEAPYHAEAWVAFEAAWLRILLDLVKNLKGYKVKIRPHPIEKIEYYRFLEKKFGVEVSNHEDLSEWLESVDVMISYLSTAQLAAYVRGVNVISIKNLFPVYIHNTLPAAITFELDQYFHAPSSIEELKNSLKENKCDREKLDHYASQMFNFPSKDRPSVLIAEHLAGFVEEKLKTKAKFKRIPEGRITNLIPDFIPKDTLLMLYRDWFYPKEQVSLSYCRHRFLRNRRVHRTLPDFENKDLKRDERAIPVVAR